MRRPAPETISDIRHPGPKAEDRHPHIGCHAKPVSIDLAQNQPLLDALGDWAQRSGFGSAVLDLAGLHLKPFSYVMPDRAVDDRHAAWYSDTKSSNGAVLEEAVAILGWKDGSWFAHIHAYWNEDDEYHLGHLLPDTLAIGKNSRVTGFGLQGARFVAAPDPETEFTLFRVQPDQLCPQGENQNALITTLAPFADFYESVEHLGASFCDGSFDVHGLGSFAGAQFLNSVPMTGLISEIFVAPNAGRHNEERLNLPVRCVDLHGHLYKGEVSPGAAPTLVTCELLLIETASAEKAE